MYYVLRTMALTVLCCLVAAPERSAAAWTARPDGISAFRLTAAASDRALELASNAWLDTADRMRDSLTPGSPLPVGLTTTRAAFEAAWLDAGLGAKRATDQASLRRALSQTIRSYRHPQESPHF